MSSQKRYEFGTTVFHGDEDFELMKSCYVEAQSIIQPHLQNPRDEPVDRLAYALVAVELFKARKAASSSLSDSDSKTK